MQKKKYKKKCMIDSRVLILMLFGFWTNETLAQDLNYKVEMQSSLSSHITPLWLNANKYGLSSLEKSNGYFLAGVEKKDSLTGDRKTSWGAGLELATTYNYTSSLVLQQAYVEGRWLHGALTIGAKEYPMELKNSVLSSGSQALGINARPVPQIRVALPEYKRIWKWLYIKGHVAYGMFTDNAWQRKFTDKNSMYCQQVLYHSKAGYLRLGNPEQPLTVELGLEMATQFGGRSYATDGTVKRGGHRLKDFWDVLLGGGSDPGEGKFANAEGNQVGSWVGRIRYDQPSYCISLYWDHYFEDHSQMFFVDYDGYGHGSEWNDKKKGKFYLYDFKDIMLGSELNLKKGTWLRDLVAEYLYTKYQSGPIYHDHGTLVSYHIAGDDDYCNHGIYCSWQHWGQVMGNPLYRSPIYNDNGQIRVQNNRFIAWHIGFDGYLNARMNERGEVQSDNLLSYRVLTTFQKGWGTYNVPYLPVQNDFSMLLELNYTFKHGWKVKGTFGLDAGGIYGNNKGIQLSVVKVGIL
jgi:hypothetical protein